MRGIGDVWRSWPLGTAPRESEGVRLKRRIAELEARIQAVREETTDQVKSALDDQIQALAQDAASSRELLRDAHREIQRLFGVLQSSLLPGPGRMVVQPFWSTAPVGIDGRAALVLMPFHARWSSAVHAAIAKALSSVGMRCTRGDELAGRTVMADVWRSICESGLVIADLTDSNANVTYELGLVDGIGQAAVLICQSPNPDSLPFDFLGQRLVVYSVDRLDDLERELVNRIRTLRGTGARQGNRP